MSVGWIAPLIIFPAVIFGLAGLAIGYGLGCRVSRIQDEQ